MKKELKDKIHLAQDDENTAIEELEESRRQLILAFREKKYFLRTKKQRSMA